MKYYRLMIELCQHDHDYMAICKHYREIFNTTSVQEDESQWQAVSTCTLMQTLFTVGIVYSSGHEKVSILDFFTITLRP